MKHRVLSLICMLVLCLAHVPRLALAIPNSLDGLRQIQNNVIETTVLHGAIGSLSRPTFGRMMDADLSLDNHDPVFIVEFPDGPRIYPQKILVWHQVVNEFLRNVAYAVTYCPITGSLAAYQATLDGTPLFFDVQGSLYGGNSVLIDRNTGSLWLQGLGIAFEGPLMGRGLPKLPVFWTTWQAAKRVYKDALVLSSPTNTRKAYGRDPYGSYLKEGTYYDNDTLAYPLRFTDLRLPYKQEVIGLEFNDFRLAIDIEYVKKNGLVNFFLGPMPLLAIHDTKLDVIRVFNRQVWEKPSLFVLDDGKLTDLESKTIWTPDTGRAIEGNMVGASMPQYFGVYSMWFNWYNINPETYLIPGPGEVPKNILHAKPLDQE